MPIADGGVRPWFIVRLGDAVDELEARDRIPFVNCILRMGLVVGAVHELKRLNIIHHEGLGVISIEIREITVEEVFIAHHRIFV